MRIAKAASVGEKSPLICALMLREDLFDIAITEKEAKLNSIKKYDHFNFEDCLDYVISEMPSSPLIWIFIVFLSGNMYIIFLNIEVTLLLLSLWTK